MMTKPATEIESDAASPRSRRWLGPAWRCGVSVFSGLLLALAFPPFNEQAAAWFAFVPLLIMARFTAPRAAFRWGFAGGLVFWLISLSWILALSRTGGPPVLVALGWVALSAYCALYTGAFAAAVAYLPQGRNGGATAFPASMGFVFAVPLLWVGLEYLRSTMCTGFPWNALGISQARNLAVIQLAEWGGVYAVSALLMLMNGGIAVVVMRLGERAARRPVRRRVQLELMVGLLACALSWSIGLKSIRRTDLETRMSGASLRVAAVQPNVPQLKKWPTDYGAEIMEKLTRQTELASAAGPELILWPETSIPELIRAEEREILVAGMAGGSGAYCLVGALEWEDDSAGAGETSGTDLSRGRLYNTAFLIDAAGRIQERYRKRHLVPFGEYLPFESRIPFLAGFSPLGFSCSPGEEATLFTIPGRIAPEGVASGEDLAFSVLICFEDAFAYLARDAVKAGARFLVNQTNDAWFDGTCGAVQHMSHCVFRCIETRVAAVRCANSGVTCTIDRVGRVDIFESDGRATGVEGFKLSTLLTAPANAPLTFYARYGDWPFAIPCAAGVVLFGALLAVSRWRRAPGR